MYPYLKPKKESLSTVAVSALDLLISQSNQSAAVLNKDTDQDKAKIVPKTHVRHYKALVKSKQTAISHIKGVVCV